MRAREALGATLFGAALVTLLMPACGTGPSPAAVDVGDGVDQPAAEPSLPAPRRMADGLLPGMKRRRDPALQIEVTPQCNSNPKLSYFQGPILQTPVIVPVSWNSNVNASVQSSMPQFYADVMASSYWGWLQEYDTVGLSGGTSQVILPGTVAAGVVLTPSRCPAGSTTTCKVSDVQIQSELNAQISAGALPAPTVDCTGNTQTIYMIEFPHNVQVSGPSGTGTSCVQYCAYHNTGTYTAGGVPLVYGVLMDQFTGGCATGCGGNSQPLDNMTVTASHELVEAVTDPDIGLDTSAGYAKPAGWADKNCGEIGDICDDNGTGDAITVSGRTWRVQQEWSNKQNKCASTGPVSPVCAGTNLTGCRKCGCGDDGGACSGATSVCETTGSNVLFGACEQCTSATNTCGTSGSCQQSSTPAQDDVCVGGCTPATACPNGQSCGTASDGCGGTIDCGTCTAPQTCGGGGTPNVCGCTPATSCPAGDVCGKAPDGCGGTVDCGACAAGEACMGNACVAGGSSSSSASSSTSSSGGTGGSASSSSGTGGSPSSSSSGSFGGSGTGGAATGMGGTGTTSSGHGTGAGVVAPPGQPGGCSCEAAGDPRGTSGTSASALGLLALAGVLGARRRRA